MPELGAPIGQKSDERQFAKMCQPMTSLPPAHQQDEQVGGGDLIVIEIRVMCRMMNEIYRSSAAAAAAANEKTV